MGSCTDRSWIAGAGGPYNEDVMGHSRAVVSNSGDLLARPRLASFAKNFRPGERQKYYFEFTCAGTWHHDSYPSEAIVGDSVT